MAGITVRELAEAVGGTVQGAGDVLITGAASVSEAEPGDVVLAENARYLAAAEMSRASAVVSADGKCGTKPVIKVADPRRAFVEILRRLAPQARPPRPGIDPTCRVGARVTCGEAVSVGYGCFIGDDVTIGDGTLIYPLVYLGDGVRIGAQSVIHPHVTIYPGSELGSRVMVHAGTVIGSDGFGYLAVGDDVCKVPQIGKVVIEDDVEIGANVTIDRAKTGATKIGRCTKIDNLVQIAHNVKIGEKCMIVAQVGLAGSIELGDGVTIAGQAGLKDHVVIGDGAVVAAQAGVFGDLPAGGIYSGYPARPHREQLRAQAAFLRLPEMQKTMADLKKEVERLNRRLAQLGGDESEFRSE